MAKGRKHSAVAGSRSASAASKDKPEGGAPTPKPEPPKEPEKPEPDVDNAETQSIAESDVGKNRDNNIADDIVGEDDSHNYCEPSLSEIIVTHYEGGRGRGGLYDGFGEAKFVGGNTYKGSFDNGQMHGKGTYMWNNGIRYEGDFANNRITGYGTYKWPDNSSYEGEVSDGMRHGVGVFKSPDQGISFSGQWYLGKRHGRGVMNYGEQSWYEGDWVNNARHGYGIRRYKTGNVYEGHWTNDKRHGDGTMRWLSTNETYRGMWENGVQHGYGTHTWYVQRVPGSQYPLRNEYVGEFVNGLRHGRGKFFYASGAVYDGEWENGKKSGWGKFIFNNGRVFEGQFDNDHMVEYPGFELSGMKTPDLLQIRTRTPVGHEQDICSDQQEGFAIKPPPQESLTLELTTLLEDFPESDREVELKQVTHLALRNITILRRAYSFYSALGHDQSLDNTFVMTRFQFWRFLKDCHVHHCQKSLFDMDRAIARCHAADDMHNPMEKILLREFLSNLVILAHCIFKDDINSIPRSHGQNAGGKLTQCLQKLLTDHITRYSCIVKGYFLFEPRRAITALSYMDKCWQIYTALTTRNPNSPHDLIIKMRHFLLFLRDLKVVGKGLTASNVLKVLCHDDPNVYADDVCNLEIEMTFLEFFEALIGCSQIYQFEIDDQLANDPETEYGHRLQSSRGSSPTETMSHHAESHRSVTRSPSALSQATLDAHSSQLQSQSAQQLSMVSASDGLHASSSLISKGSPKKEGAVASTGVFLQTLSEMSVKEQEGATSNYDETGSEAQGVAQQNLDTSGSEDAEYSAWADKLHYFFTMRLFPAWDKSVMLKSDILEYNKLQSELERAEAVRKEADRRTQSFQTPKDQVADEIPQDQQNVDENAAGDQPEESSPPIAETPLPDVAPSASSVKAKSGKGGKKRK